MPLLSAQRRLILFGRYPVPGHTKTRLIPLLGALGAAELQRELTEQALSKLSGAGLAPVDFVYSGGTAEQVNLWMANRRVSLSPQSEGDLGDRMQCALEAALARGARQAILVGTDVPEMNAEHIARAFDALADADLVLGPSNDGGYWLIGCRRPVALFDGIEWGSEQVLSQTMASAERLGLSVALLPPLIDVDTPEDLRAWQPTRDWHRPYLSVIIPTLNEAGRIGETLERVRRVGIEIIVADGGSRDGTPEIARRAGAVVVHAPSGRAVQQNVAARLAKGRVLLFLHADTRLPRDFDEQVFELLMDRRVVLGAFQFKTDWHHGGMRLIERAAMIRSRWLKMPYGDQAFFMRRSLFFQVGGFPEVPIAEDLLLAKKMARLGRVDLVPSAAITSGRRWQHLGIWRTTLINYIIAAGSLLGVDPGRLARLYRVGLKGKKLE